MTRRLTKSRFKLAQECPTKLFYTRKRDVYPDTSFEDSFLAALAEGGNQVGELATLYFPGGTNIETLDEALALEQTSELLANEDAIIYEAAILFENLFIRVDVLVKRGDKVQLIEVKAKSCEGGSAEQFMTKTGGIRSGYLPYLEDVSFQKHVMAGAYPGLEITAFLMLMDKQTACPTDGLHQKFLIVQDEHGRAGIRLTAPLDETELEHPMLRKINVDELADQVLGRTDHGPSGDMAFGPWVAFLSQAYEEDRKITTAIGGKCSKCQFRASHKQKQGGARSGLEECWTASPQWSGGDIDTPLVLELGNFRGKQELIDAGKTKLSDVTQDDIGYDGEEADTMSTKQRQWLHARSVQQQDSSMHLLTEQLRAEMDTWSYPLHFIDFETASPAIPFHKGLRCYEQLAFQFSHHMVFEDGRVEHSGEYIDVETGHFPNFDMVRELQRQLEGDQGSIFMYSPHENTILSRIRTQLIHSDSPPADRASLITFIESIAHPTKSASSKWPTPKRDMIDMLVTVKNFYYDPAMGGSNSIKHVLPAILNGSQFLQDKYSQPIYGAPGGIQSLNFEHKLWVERDDAGRVLDPYRLLPKLFDDATQEQLDTMLTYDDELANGGAAMTAYARLQFTEMQPTEREILRGALLKYCELDTLAMVMIFEAWKDWTRP